MRLFTVPRPRGTVPVGALLMAPLFGLPLGAWLVETGRIDLGICGMQAAFELPCLTCGATRATMGLLGGQVWKAVTFQPLIISLYFMLMIWGSMSLWTFLRDRKFVLEMSNREDLLFKAALIVVPFVNWFYLFRIGV